MTELAALLPKMAARAESIDRAASFPEDDIADLRAIGALMAPVPRALGGLGAGTEPDGAALIRDLLVAIGRANLSVARLFEAHVNAIRLVSRFGDAAAQAGTAADIRQGALFGLWVTDAGGGPVSAQDGRIVGSKSPCSGAGHCALALITAVAADGVRMAIVAPSGTEPVRPIAGMQGMRAAANGAVDLTGLAVRYWVGGPGDYLREPDFSCGAWRASAAASGAVAALVEAVAAVLRRREQMAAPMQLARFGAMLTARDTAALWVERMGAAAEGEGPGELRVATVNLGRGAVERAALEVIQLAQRSLGMGAFLAPEPVERIGRDLAMYLRQPAVDAVLLEAAAWHLAHEAVRV